MSLKLVAAAAAVASAFALSACGDKKEAAPAKPATPAAPAAQSKAAEPLKVGFVYVAPIADVGYTKQHDIGRIYAIDKVGKDKVTTTFVENVPETADAERVIRQMVADGNKLIFGTSFGYMNYMQKLAKEYPDVKTAADSIVKVTETIEPDGELTEKYEKQYSKFRQMYPALKAVFQNLGE